MLLENFARSPPLKRTIRKPPMSDSTAGTCTKSVPRQHRPHRVGDGPGHAGGERRHGGAEQAHAGERAHHAGNGGVGDPKSRQYRIGIALSIYRHLLLTAAGSDGQDSDDSAPHQVHRDERLVQPPLIRWMAAARQQRMAWVGELTFAIHLMNSAGLPSDRSVNFRQGPRQLAPQSADTSDWH